MEGRSKGAGEAAAEPRAVKLLFKAAEGPPGGVRYPPDEGEMKPSAFSSIEVVPRINMCLFVFEGSRHMFIYLQRRIP